MRKFLFDVILGIFIGIGACAAGIIAIMDKIDELKRKSLGFAEVVDNLVTGIKDLIHHLLYGYHHNRSAGAYNTRNFSYSTTNDYKSIYGWWNSTGRWNSTSKDDADIKAESEYPREDDEEEVSNGH